jgi:hypothetical protein
MLDLSVPLYPFSSSSFQRDIFSSTIQSSPSYTIPKTPKSLQPYSQAPSGGARQEDSSYSCTSADAAVEELFQLTPLRGILG